MQSVLSRIWTRVAVSTSYDDNHYTTGTFLTIWYTRKPESVQENEMQKILFWDT